jgi:hypothetical protein
MEKMLIYGLFETFWTFIQDIGCPSISLKNFPKIEILNIGNFFSKNREISINNS